jgi:hypothetical protein
MAIHFNQREIAPIPGANGVARQPLLNAARVPGILLARSPDGRAGGQAALSIASNELRVGCRVNAVRFARDIS